MVTRLFSYLPSPILHRKPTTSEFDRSLNQSRELDSSVYHSICSVPSNLPPVNSTMISQLKEHSISNNSWVSSVVLDKSMQGQNIRQNRSSRIDPNPNTIQRQRYMMVKKEPDFS